METIVNDFFMHRAIKRLERKVDSQWRIAVKGDEVMLGNGEFSTVPETIDRVWMEELPSSVHRALVDAAREENPAIDAFLPGPSIERDITTPSE